MRALFILSIFTFISKSRQGDGQPGDASYEPELHKDTLTPEYGRVVFASIVSKL